MMTTCLLISTKDNEKYFTQIKNYAQLIEFAKTFKANIIKVKAESPSLLPIKKLAEHITTGTVSKSTKYEIIETLIENHKEKRIILSTKPKRQEMSKNIKKYIKTKLLAGNVLSLTEISTEFENYGLTKSCFSNHFSNVRKQLEKNNRIFAKKGAGKYVLVDF